MPFAFLIVGVILVVSGVKGTSSQLLTLVKGDLQGTNGYLYWLVAILIIGSVGYIPAFKGLSRAFLVLVLVSLVLKEGKTTNAGGGFFQQFTSALKQISQPTPGNSLGGGLAASTPAVPAGNSAGGSLASTAPLLF